MKERQFLDFVGKKEIVVKVLKPQFYIMNSNADLAIKFGFQAWFYKNPMVTYGSKSLAR